MNFSLIQEVCFMWRQQPITSGNDGIHQQHKNTVRDNSPQCRSSQAHLVLIFFFNSLVDHNWVKLDRILKMHAWEKIKVM